jgi:hypothetical protein
MQFQSLRKFSLPLHLGNNRTRLAFFFRIIFLVGVWKLCLFYTIFAESGTGVMKVHMSGQFRISYLNVIVSCFFLPSKKKLAEEVWRDDRNDGLQLWAISWRYLSGKKKSKSNNEIYLFLAFLFLREEIHRFLLASTLRFLLRLLFTIFHLL